MKKLNKLPDNVSLKLTKGEAEFELALRASYEKELEHNG